jgi:hypothetical protein
LILVKTLPSQAQIQPTLFERGEYQSRKRHRPPKKRRKEVVAKNSAMKIDIEKKRRCVRS